MDRRDALRKLGVGGAVAVSAPVLLDTFRVAHASSTELPPADNDILSSVSDNGGAGVAIVLDTSQFPSDTGFIWFVTRQTGGFPLTTVSPLTGPSTVVDKAGPAGPGSFTVVMIAFSPSSTPRQRVYLLDWNGSQLVVS